MCGKFTARLSWSELVAFFERMPDGADDQGGDPSVTFRVMDDLPVVVWDRVAGLRRVVPMRWGFPHPNDWKRPQPIHARAESIDTTRAFADAFRDGQRGIVLMRTFNEAPDSGAQHVIVPGDGMRGIAFVWRRFEAPLFACVMVTVAANALLTGLPTDRMPAILAPEDWAGWLGETEASLDALQAMLKTTEGADWTMTPEQRKAKAPRAKPTVSDPGGLF